VIRASAAVISSVDQFIAYCGLPLTADF